MRAPANVLLCECNLNRTLPNESVSGEPAGGCSKYLADVNEDGSPYFLATEEQCDNYIS